MKPLVNYSIKNSLLVNVVFIFIICAGLYSILNMQREAYPRFSFDVVVVTTYYPGATPAEIEKLITIPIEKELKQIENIEEITSVSAEGISRISLKIEEDAPNKDRTINDIQRAVDRVDDLPSDLKDKPLVNDVKTQDKPIIEIALSGDMDESTLQSHVRALEKRLLDLPSVARIQRNGYRDREIWVEVSSQTIQNKQISIDDISKALRKQNKTIPGGKYYINNQEHIVRTTGQLESAQDVENTVVRASPFGNHLLVKDVAAVKDGFAEETIINKSFGSRSINLIVVKKAAGDTIEMVKNIKKVVKRFQEQTGPTLKVAFINDVSFYVQRRQNVLFNNGTLGMLLVIISLFTFLSIRTAIGACAGIPTALFLAFLIMPSFDITFNLISMFGLIMVLGMLVDEDIVISENIYRHLELGKSPESATTTGVLEVAKPLVVTVLTTVAAFLPLLMMGGVMGKFTRPIPFVVTITLFASLFQALLILPSHICHLNKASLFGKPIRHKQSEWIVKLIKKYQTTLTHALKHKYVYSLAIFLVLVGSLFFAANYMKFVLFPSRGVEIFFIEVEGDEGDSLIQTSQKIRTIENMVASLPKEELDAFVTTVGLVQQDPDDPQTIRASNVAQVKVYLTPESVRDRDSQSIINELRQSTQNVSIFKTVEFQMRRMGPPVGKPIEVRITGDDFATLTNLSKQFQDRLKTIDGVDDINDDYNFTKDEIRIVLDPIKVAQTGLTVEEVAQSVRNAFDGNISTTITTSEEEIDIRVKLPEPERYQSDTLDKLLVPNDQKRLIKLSDLANFVVTKGLLSIKHFDGTRSINVSANIDENKASALEISRTLEPLIEKSVAANPEYKIQFGGEVKESTKSLQNLFNAFYLSGALILIILIGTFHSLLQPLIIMFSIPCSIIGVVFAFFVHKEPFSFMSLLGVVGLTGVVVDSGVILIDFINKLRDKGMDTHTSIIEGAGMRLRAVVLTSLTTFLGIIPAAYGIGGSDPFIRPMALALNYGIVFGAVVAVFFLPLFISIVDDLRALSKRLMSRPTI